MNRKTRGTGMLREECGAELDVPVSQAQQMAGMNEAQAESRSRVRQMGR